jgi:hypothetical protein
MGDVLHLVSMDLVTSPVPKAAFFFIILDAPFLRKEKRTQN